MKLDTAISRLNDARLRLREVYSRARHFGFTQDELLKEIVKIRENLKGAPRWALSEFTGYDRALHDGLYEHLIYGGYVDGVFYSTHQDRPDYYQKHGIQPSEYADEGRVTNRGHYWSTTKTIKPFFVN